MEQNARRLRDFRDRSCFSTVTILAGIAPAQIGRCFPVNKKVMVIMHVDLSSCSPANGPSVDS
ncbi:hypothetical protein FOXB_03145 [Fusarium oxysporum f. sp. conglutinans Fo5176]|uniref:Uncharacterized protein n=1 Tax=Fusarium oxysporum (strain Fo5176) TaxID=660025 RepID=F9F9S0_FUSOF|nr:hypothetical protein FOXB_03145 [Fusarium oxysporum f. sp. conglutinans Fo5176]